MCWGVALLLAEIAPRYQNEILSQGFRYGESSVITGFHFASDIQDGRMLASAVVARMHADSQFAALIAGAKEALATLGL